MKEYTVHMKAHWDPPAGRGKRVITGQWGQTIAPPEPLRCSNCAGQGFFASETTDWIRADCNLCQGFGIWPVPLTELEDGDVCDIG